MSIVIKEMIMTDFVIGAMTKNEIMKYTEHSPIYTNIEQLEKEFIFNLAKYTYWEGDGEILYLPMYDSVSDCGRMHHCAYVKQSNNGTSWIGYFDHNDNAFI